MEKKKKKPGRRKRSEENPLPPSSHPERPIKGFELKVLRYGKGATMDEMGVYADISKQAYQQIEAKGICATNESTARKICIALGVNVFQVVGEDILKFHPRNKKEADYLLALMQRIRDSFE